MEDEIAVIGAGCKLPGGLVDLPSLWEDLQKPPPDTRFPLVPQSRWTPLPKPTAPSDEDQKEVRPLDSVSSVSRLACGRVLIEEAVLLLLLVVLGRPPPRRLSFALAGSLARRCWMTPRCSARRTSR